MGNTLNIGELIGSAIGPIVLRIAKLEVKQEGIDGLTEEEVDSRVKARVFELMKEISFQTKNTSIVSDK